MMLNIDDITVRHDHLKFEMRERTIAELWQGPAPLIVMVKTL